MRNLRMVCVICVSGWGSTVCQFGCRPGGPDAQSAHGMRDLCVGLRENSLFAELERANRNVCNSKEAGNIYPPAGKVDAPPAKAPSKFDVKPLSDRHSAQGGRLRNFLKSDRNVENHSAFGHRREGGPC